MSRRLEPFQELETVPVGWMAFWLWWQQLEWEVAARPKRTGQEVNGYSPSLFCPSQEGCKILAQQIPVWSTVGDAVTSFMRAD